MNSLHRKPLTALALNATLKNSHGGPSSTQQLLEYVESHLAPLGVTTQHIRLSDYEIAPGVTSDEGDGDQWPEIRKKIVACDILLMGTPIWLGQPSSICKRALERMDAFLSETDAENHMPFYPRVAGVVVVGNEDGAHHVSAELYQALNDVGFTIPANAVSYWVGEAMQSTDFKDLKVIPDTVVEATKLLAINCAHLARILREDPYPANG
ncbi:flavodoxin family protein [Ochrobactrum sp. BTU1]|uniref:flavodoxin family protein n=1 Tax=Ochrobactrum sp. BTU1 TaxID=2840456 RepID=UPI001C046C3D|nr:flavodoxin family protein [Ochrobactrum sp. BTU1]